MNTISARSTRTLSLGLVGLLVAGGTSALTTAAVADDAYAPVAAVVPTLAPITLEPATRYTISKDRMWCWDDTTMAEDDEQRSSAAFVNGFTPRSNAASAGSVGSDANITTWISDGDSIRYFGTSAGCSVSSTVWGDVDGAWDLTSFGTPPELAEQYATDPGDGAVPFDGSWWKRIPLDNVDAGAPGKFIFTGDKVLGPFTADTRPVRVWYGNVPGVNTGITPNPGVRIASADSAYIAVAQPGLSVLREVCIDGLCDPADDAAWGKDVLVPRGSDVRWRTTVSNTGNLTLTGLTVSDDGFAGDDFPTTLAPGASASVVYTQESLVGAVTSPATASADFADPTRAGAFLPGQSIGERYIAAASALGQSHVLTATDEASARTPDEIVPEIVDPEIHPIPEEKPLTEGSGSVTTADLAATGGRPLWAGVGAAIAALVLGALALVARRRGRAT